MVARVGGAVCSPLVVRRAHQLNSADSGLALNFRASVKPAK